LCAVPRPDINFPTSLHRLFLLARSFQSSFPDVSSSVFFPAGSSLQSQTSNVRQFFDDGNFWYWPSQHRHSPTSVALSDLQLKQGSPADVSSGTASSHRIHTASSIIAHFLCVPLAYSSTVFLAQLHLFPSGVFRDGTRRPSTGLTAVALLAVPVPSAYLHLPRSISS